jgi:hypothetical protein
MQREDEVCELDSSGIGYWQVAGSDERGIKTKGFIIDFDKLSDYHFTKHESALWS